jgi:diketogulonate reductase-like aldo/keto reductase
MRQIRFPGGIAVPSIGQGTWHMGEPGSDRAAEVAALRHGLALGLSLIDTAEMYADGGAEDVVGEAIADLRDQVFLVSKVYPHNAARAGVIAACERSLRRLRTGRIDLYLLHWRGDVPLQDTIAGFEALREVGKIGAWGVSNFDPRDMTELARTRHGHCCATNQILYNPEHRGVEFDLLGWCAEREMPVMAYSPVGQGGRLLRAPALRAVAARHGVTTAQVALAWALRQPGVIVIPKAATPAHVGQNAAAAEIMLTPVDLAEIDAAYPPPRRAAPLAML